METPTLHGKIEHYAQVTPDKIAVEYGKEFLTYAQLGERSELIGDCITSGIGCENRNVVVFLDRGLHLVETIVGIIKAGYIFIPLDTKYPENRLKMMIAETNAELIITESRYLSKLARITEDERPIKILLIDHNEGLTDQFQHLPIFRLGNHRKSPRVEQNTLINKHCYIYFTSGTTSKPKGILGRHKSLKHFVDWEIGEFGVDHTFRVSQFTSPSFDPFLRDLFVPLCAGATLCIPEDQELILQPEKLVEWVERNNITLIHMVPLLFKLMGSAINSPDCLKGLKYVLLAGEQLKGSDVLKFLDIFAERIQLVNLYGPTETTLAKMFYRIKPEDKHRTIIPVGKPINSTEVLLLDEDLRRSPIGSIGEVYIRTPYITSGYFNDKELTKKSFIKNPFSGNLQDIIYKTGDLGRILNDGNLELLGRKDNQVKIRGIRIELGEIEDRLLRLELMKAAAVIPWEDEDGDKYLCAYIIYEGNLSIAQIKEYLLKELPKYMVPSYIVPLEAMPLAPNGKLDRKALPQPDRNIPNTQTYQEPQNEIQRKIWDVWRQVLRNDHLGIDDNFFMVGGNSLKAIQIVGKLSSDFKIRINDIFAYPTIAELAQNITEEKESIWRRLQAIKEILSSGQEISVTSEMDVKYHHYLHECEQYQELNYDEQTEYQNVLLTGATGFLGIHILDNILELTNSNIYIIARGASEVAAKNRLGEKYRFYFGKDIEAYATRLKVLNGDLTTEYFGLTPAQYADLARTIDCVINSAANVKHYGHFESFYSINVAGTKRLIEFAVQDALKDFHHISTVGVARGSVKGKDSILFTEYDADCVQEIDSYYDRTKLEAEKLVLAAKQAGLPANIYRVGNLVFNSQNGVFQDNVEDNGLYQSIKAFIKLGIVPDTKYKIADFSFIDFISRAIVKLVYIKQLKNEIFHLYNNKSESLAVLGQLLVALGLKIKLVSVEEFINSVQHFYNIAEYQPYIENILVHSRMFEKLDKTRFVMVNDKTNIILAKMGMCWEELNQAHVDRMIAYCKKVNFL